MTPPSHLCLFLLHSLLILRLVITGSRCDHLSVSSEPEGMSAPEVVPVNSSTARVLWLPPLRPNGAVTGYHIYVNDRLHGSADNSSGSHLLGGLLPFTVYSVQVCAQALTAWVETSTHAAETQTFSFCLFGVLQVEVCTVYACTRSNVTQMTTVEDLPADISAPHTQVMSPR